MTDLNADIKRTAMYYGIKQRELADGLGISTATLSRWLKKDLSIKQKAEIMNTIDQLGTKKHG